MKLATSAALATLAALAPSTAPALTPPLPVFHCVIVQAFGPLQPDGTLTDKGAAASLVGKTLVFDSRLGLLRIADQPQREVRVEWGADNVIAIAMAQGSHSAAALVETLQIQVRLQPPPFLYVGGSQVLSGTCRTG